MYEYCAMLVRLALAVAVGLLVASPLASAQTAAPSPATVVESAPSSPQLFELPIQGPPTTYVLVQGASFDPLTAIDVYFDSTKLASTTTDKNGSFGNGVVTATGPTFTRLQVPANAMPGQHTITAQERVGQKSAAKSFLVQTDWPQFRFDAQHSGFNSYENVLNPANVQNLALDWQYALPAQINENPVVANGVVYFTTGYQDYALYAVNAATGALLWKNATVGASYAPTVANGLVYIGGQSPTAGVYAFNASTGDLVWRYASSVDASQITVADGVLYAGVDTAMVALDPSTGKFLWSYVTDAAVQSPAVANGAVYFQTIYFIYPNTYVNTLYAVDASTHQVRWQHQWTLGGALIPPPVVGGSVVYFDGSAFDAVTGTLLWGGPTGDDTIPAMANGVIYDTVQFGQNVNATNATTGEPLWTFRAGGEMEGTPAVANGVVSFECDDGYAYALDAATGAQLWKYQISSRGPSSPVVADGVAYFPSAFGSGGLWAFHLPNQERSEHSSSPQPPNTAVLTPGSGLQPSAGATPNPK